MKHSRPANWCKPMPATVTVEPTEFERRVEALRLRSEAQMLKSRALREWAAKNWKRRYVPEPLLTAWNLATEFELENLE